MLHICTLETYKLVTTERAHLDYSRVVAVPENPVWLALCLLLAARLRNTTLLTKGGLPPEMDSQVMNCVTKGYF